MPVRPLSLPVSGGVLLGLGLALAGCQQMSDPGQPFAPVATQASVGGTSVGTLPDPDPRFPPKGDEPMVISSDTLAENARKSQKKRETLPPENSPADPAAGASLPPADGAAPAPADGTAAPADGDAAAPAPAAAPVPGTAAPAREDLSAPKGSAWPVRVVSTLPDTQPPRAILGLPDGREVVVTAGSMIPDQGIVVMAIGAERVQIARISASGDHAVIREESVDAQY